MARVNPSCAMTASSLACALLNAASVATMAIVVFSPGRPFGIGISASGASSRGKPRPPNSRSTSKGAAQKCGPRPTLTLPQALTTARAATGRPSRVSAEAGPSPHRRLLVGGPQAAAGGAARDCGAGLRGGVVHGAGMGGNAPPVLVAAVEDIDHRGAPTGRLLNVADGKPAAAFAQQRLAAGARVQAEGRAAGE